MKEKIIATSFKGYQFGFSPTVNVSDQICTDLLNSFQAIPRTDSHSGAGRRCISTLSLPTVGSVVVKHYMRGGLLQYLLKKSYIRLGNTRAQDEFDLLRTASTLGVNVPEAVAFASKGFLFYNAWLVTKNIPHVETMAERAIRDDDKLHMLVESLIQQIHILIENRIFHIDLHPGNVLVDKDDKVYLLDFDKAEHFVGRKNKLRDRYLVRWRRAVLKHQLPESLSELVSLGLRRHLE